VSWGDGGNGGDDSALSTNPNFDLASIKTTSNSGAFATIKENRSVLTWGSGYIGGDSSLVKADLNGATPIVDVVAKSDSMLALSEDGVLVTWGSSTHVEETNRIISMEIGQSKIQSIYSSQTQFLALREDNSIIAWGYGSIFEIPPGEISVKAIIPAYSAFAILFENGEVMALGSEDTGGSIELVKEQLNNGIPVVSIIPNRKGFAALKEDGAVVAWGRDNYSSNYVPSWKQGLIDGTTEQSKVVTIVASDTAFSVLRQDGSVVSWGEELNGGNSPESELDGSVAVTSLVGANQCIAALRSDGSVVVWGNSRIDLNSYGEVHGCANISNFINELSSGVTRILSSGSIVGLVKNNSLLTLGPKQAGGQKTIDLGINDLVSMHTTQDGLALILSDGSVQTFGFGASSRVPSDKQKLLDGIDNDSN
jgi:alpha-tubulin suppressor-like RCC1 family protein